MPLLGSGMEVLAKNARNVFTKTLIDQNYR